MDDHKSPTLDFFADVAHVGSKTQVANSGSFLRGSTDLAHGKDLHGIVSAAMLDVLMTLSILGLPPPNSTLDGSKSKYGFLDANLGLGLDSVQMKGIGYDVISSDWEVARKVRRDSLKSDPNLGVGVDVAGSGALAPKNVVSGFFLNSTIGVNVAGPSFAQVVKDQDNDFLGAGPSINISKDLGPKEGVEEKGKKKFWVEEEAVNGEDLILPKCVNASHSDNAKSPITKTAHLEEGLHVDAATVLPDQQNESKDSSSFEESKSDSLNTSDLSPSKVFALEDESW
ncbi:hypothetical protein PanWU01x14_170740 [Parasponia andersonii]|uniref:Uncharacterized protein n=1 Tax=Parasponia andersonii TaxID=3476 RepID=A0A2P5CA10_PARAD|nr:hypothetical protein PanWU01x14_170740 [Parasponia andersonii]